MKRKEQLKLKILELLQQHKVLNSSQICRLLNNIPEWQEKGCTNTDLANFCKKCEWSYFYLLDTLESMRKNNHIYQVKRFPFWDTKHGKRNIDLFTFNFLDFEDFKEKILSQTMILFYAEELEKVKNEINKSKRKNHYQLKKQAQKQMPDN